MVNKILFIAPSIHQEYSYMKLSFFKIKLQMCRNKKDNDLLLVRFDASALIDAKEPVLFITAFYISVNINMVKEANKFIVLI